MTAREPILVTGATGFIGRRVVARLVAEGVRVRALVLPAEVATAGAGFAGDVEVSAGDIGDAAAVAAATRGVSGIIHLAAVVGDWGPAALFERVTVQGTRNVIDGAVAAGVRLVLASSIVFYGDALGRDVCDEAHPVGRPLGHYSRTKQQQEQLAREAEARRGLELVVVRPGNVYGVGSKLWVEEVAAQLRRGMPVLIDGGHQHAGLAHVDAVVDVLVRALETPAARGRVYNANDGGDVTWARYFGDLARLIGAGTPRSLPRWLVDGLARAGEAVWTRLGRASRPPITREAVNLVGSHHRTPIERARRELGFVPPVAYDDAIRAIGRSLNR